MKEFVMYVMIIKLGDRFIMLECNGLFFIWQIFNNNKKLNLINIGIIKLRK